MLAMAFILNFLWLLIKWIRWYFLGANTTLYWRAHAVYTLYALFIVLQFSSIVLLYVSILESSINPNTVIVPPYSSSRSI